MSFPLRGDVYWINLDPTVGAEIQKTRPGVIISPQAEYPLNPQASKIIYIHRLPR